DLVVRARVHDFPLVVDHDDAERPALTRIGLGPGLPGRERLQPRAEALRVEPRVEELLGRRRDLPADGQGVLVGHARRFWAARPVTNASSAASWSVQNRR